MSEPKQTVQAGQGEGAPDLSGMIAIGRERQGIGFSGASTPPSSLWSMETMEMINKLTPNIKGKAFDPGWFLLRQRLEAIDQLRTLTAAQSVALEKAEAAINTLKAIAVEFKVRGQYPPSLEKDMDTAIAVGWETITLIQQAKEVGK